MKAKVLERMNAILAFLIGFLGLSSCEPQKKYGVPDDIVAEYGVPMAEFEMEGTVTDEANQPVPNIHVRVLNNHVPDVYTDENGKYRSESGDFFPMQSVEIVAEDTASVYQSDTVRVELEYEETEASKNSHWNEGKTTVRQDFQLRKK